MIEYKILNPSFFIKCMTGLSSIVDNTVLQFGKQLRTYGMDPSRICLYEFVIGGSEIEIISDEEKIVMVCLSDFQKILNRLSGVKELTLINDDNLIIIKGVVNDKKKTFRLNILSEDIPTDTKVKTDLNSMFNIDSIDFAGIINDAKIYSEIFTIKTTDKELIISSGGVIGSTETVIDLDIMTSEEQCSYSTYFMSGIIKTLGNQEITVAFSTDTPIMIYSKISANSFMRWHLAPRVDQDDFEDDDDI